jgi:hypothetical protein
MYVVEVLMIPWWLAARNCAAAYPTSCTVTPFMVTCGEPSITMPFLHPVTVEPVRYQ